MTARSFDSDDLWMKARLFINRAMDGARDFDECAFWAASALELLAKAALARISPLLIATPTADDGHSLLVASGVIEDAKFSSVPAKALWARCKHAFRTFDDAEARRISEQRNDYIHAGKIGFDSLPPHAWWPRFWAVATVLLDHNDKTIEEFVGRVRAVVVNAHLATNKEHQQERLSTLLERARTRLSLHDKGGLSAKLSAEWAAFSASTGYWNHETSHPCPACQTEGLLQGDEVLDRTVSDWDPEEPWGPTVWLEVSTDFFSCPHCHLELDFELIGLADLPESFSVEGDGDDIEYEPEYENE